MSNIRKKDLEYNIGEHKVRIEQLFQSRHGEVGCNILAYHKEWWGKYVVEFQTEISDDELRERDVAIRKRIFDLAWSQPAIEELLIHYKCMKSAKWGADELTNVRNHEQKWWLEYAREYKKKLSGPEIVYQYMTMQWLMGDFVPEKTFDDRVMLENFAKIFEVKVLTSYSGQAVTPETIKASLTFMRAIKNTQANPEILGKSSMTINNAKEPGLSYEQIVEGLKANRLIANQMSKFGLTKCAEYICTLERLIKKDPACDRELIARLHKEFNLPSEDRLREFLGKSSEWTYSAHEFLQ